MKDYFSEIKLKCAQYRMTYLPVDVANDFNEILTSFLLARQKFK